MFATFGIEENDWEGQLPAADASAVATDAVDPEAVERVAALRSPENQLRFIHEEARDGAGGEAIALDMQSEVYIVEWRDAAGHLFVQDDPPQRCSECRTTKFDMTDRVIEKTIRLPLKFTQIEVHRKKVWQLVEHFATVVFAEMLRLTPNPALTAKWMNEHRGYVEVGVTAPASKSALRDIFLRLALGSEAEIDGLTDASLTLAGIALMGARNRRMEELAKKAQAPTTAAASGSATSTKSS